MDIQKEQFSAGEMAQVIGIDGAQLQNWLRRSILDLPYPIAGRRLFSALFVFRFSLMKELAVYGMGPHQASSLIRRAGLNADGSIQPWLKAPAGREEALLWPSADITESDDEKRTTGHARLFLENGLASYIRAMASGETDDSVTGPNRSYLVLPVGVIAKSTFKKLEVILNERTEGTHAV